MSVTSDLLPAASLLWRPNASGHVLTAIAKATVMLEPGESRLAQEQEPICEVDGHWDDNPTRSLFIPSDLVPQKQRVDIVAVGHAFAGVGKRSRSLVARLVVGAIDKSIEVSSDRAIGPDGTVYDAGTFARMPIVYERAAGGPGTWNPVGIQRDERDRNGNVRTPNLQAKGLPPNARIEPIGFGPIAQSWPPRAERVAYHGGALSVSWSEKPLPDGFDLGFFNLAPPDQQLDVLDDATPIVLENLHPEHPRLATRLPSLRPRAMFEVRGASHVVAMVADTLWIDTDRGLCTITFRAQTTLDRADERFRVRIDLDHGAHKTGEPRRRNNTPTGLFAAESTADGVSPAGLPFGHRGPGSAETTQTQLPTVDGPNWLSRSAGPSASPAVAPRQTIADPGLPWQPTATAATPFAPAGRSQAKTVHQAGIPVPPTSPLNPSASASLVASMPSAPLQPAPALPSSPLPLPGMQAPGMQGMQAPGMQAPAMQALAMQAPAMQAPAMQAPAMQAPVMQAPVSVPLNPLSPAAAMPLHNQHNIAKPQLAGGAMAMGVGAGAAAMATSDGSAWSRTTGGPAPTHAQSAALMGLVGASNAAADLRPDGTATGGARKARGTAMQLLWFDPEILPRVRRKKPWKRIIDELESTAHDPEVDEPSPGEAAGDVEDRREVLQVLARGNPSGESGIDASLDEAVRDDGRFASPLILLAGELSLDFDELETLKAVVSIATPLTAGDEDLKTAVEQAAGYLAVPGLVSSADVARSLTTRIREAFAKGKRAVPGTYLDTESERALLEKRAYQKRKVFGGLYLRGLFFFAGSTSGVPTYIPDELSEKLPLFRRFPVRIIADVVFQADQYESHPTGLKAGAITRVIAGRV